MYPSRWRELAPATARPETVVAENLPAGKHTITVEPVGGLAGVDAFRCSWNAKPDAYYARRILASESGWRGDNRAPS